MAWWSMHAAGCRHRRQAPGTRRVVSVARSPSFEETDVIVVACWRRPVNTRQWLQVPWNRTGRTCVLPEPRPSEPGAADFVSLRVHPALERSVSDDDG